MTDPGVYRCPKCKQTIVVSSPAEVMCVKCARDMQPFPGETSRDTLRAEDPLGGGKVLRGTFQKALQA